MKNILTLYIALGGLLILGAPQIAHSATCAQKWLYYQNPGAIYGPYTACDATAVDSSPGNYWCGTDTANIYYAQKGFGTDWTTDCSKCVQGPWHYAHDGTISSGPDGMGYEGCTTDFSDKDANGNAIPWCPSVTAPTYVAQQRLGTHWEGCTPAYQEPCANFTPPTESPGVCKQWYCDPKTGATMVGGVENGSICDDGNACTTGETCSWGSCQNGTPIPPPAGDACNKPAYCDPTKGYIFTPVIQCAENQFCDKYLEACVVKPSVEQSPPSDQCNTFKSPTSVQGMLTYSVKPCDKIVFSGNLGQIVVTVMSVDYEASQSLPYISMKLMVQATVEGSPVQFFEYLKPPASVLYQGFSSQHINLYGLHLEVWPSSFSQNKNYVTLYAYYKCDDAFQMCKLNAKEQYMCDVICNWPSGGSVTSFDGAYYPPFNVSVHAPKGYQKVAVWTQKFADCGRKKLEALFGISDDKPTTIAYSVNPSTEPYALCSFGYMFGNVYCTVSPALSDVSLANSTDPAIQKAKSETVQYYFKAQEDGECINAFGHVGYELYHEMAHNFAVNNFSALNNEGLATFASYEVSTPLTLSGNVASLNCGENGYTLLPGGVSKPYEPWTSASYFTGACFLRELRNTYGPETFKKIFQYVHTLKMGSYYLLFQDIINPIVKDNFYDKVKSKYGFISDPKVYQGLQNFFD